MLTTLSILSLDQGRIWAADAIPSEEEVARRERMDEKQNGGTRPPFWVLWGRRLRSGHPQRA